jgi:chemotaxis protein methyltransferase CheR
MNAHACLSISDQEFTMFQSLIHRQTGIYLPETKKALVVARLNRRLRARQVDSFRSYFDLVGSDRDEHTMMLDSICTNETRFFREPRQFEFLDSEVLPRWRERGESGLAPKRIRAWSAACSTGEEPFSLAMLLRTHFPAADGWKVEIVASDISTKVLAAARSATWSVDRADDIPEEYRRAYMLKGVGAEEGRMRAHPSISSLVDFRTLNLNDEQYQHAEPFDLIFCRNVLIYFDRPTKGAVIERLSRHLSPTGLLFLGHAETLHSAAHALKHIGPTAYARA